MEQFIVSNPGVIVGLFGMLILIIGYLIKMGISDSQAKLKKHDQEIKIVYDRTTEIEDNYKEEFKKIRVEANDRHEKVMGEFTALKVYIAENRR